MSKRIVTFKRPDDQLNIGGQIIGPWNITEAKYDELVAIAPSHADHFNVVEVDDDGNVIPEKSSTEVEKTDEVDKPKRRNGPKE